MHQKDLFINAVCQPLVNTVKDVGLLIGSQLKLELHINSIVAKAHACSCLIYRCFVSKDRQSLIKAFTTYVRSLSSTPVVYGRLAVLVIRNIEAVQKRFTKRLPGFDFFLITSGLPYLALKVLNLGDLKLIFV